MSSSAISTESTTLITSITNSISDVERETGLAKDTLRVWERRYGFPQPERDAFDERLYPADQVKKLCIIKRLLDCGHRPGKIIGLSIQALQTIAQESNTRQVKLAAVGELHPELQQYLDLCSTHQVEELRRRLSEAQLQLGLRSFVTDLVAPLTQLIGDAWASGSLAIFEEHLFSESVQVVLRNAISHIPQRSPQSPAHPRILMTTFPQERHGLGLLMAEALFSLYGAHCISLGVQTPIIEIADAVKAQNADLVALSFSSAMNGKKAIDGLNELRSRLPDAVEIWAGGSSPTVSRQQPTQIHLTSLTGIQSSLANWRQRHGMPG
jgi:DNA-binding transcriptional MerR regulator/methylmalonyl-CoA mutase cobalamin-binding subunit